MNLIQHLKVAVLNEGFVPQEIEEDRVAICLRCPKYLDGNCLECGCEIELKAMMDYNKNPKKLFRVEKTHCPLGKWPYIDDVTGHRQEDDILIANLYNN